MTDFKIALCRFIILTLFLLTLAGAQDALTELPTTPYQCTSIMFTFNRAAQNMVLSP